MENNKKLPTLCGDNECTGCMACANICPKNAISIGRNDEGFYRPILNAEICIGCMSCEKKCPVMHPSDVKSSMGKVFAAWHKDDNVRKNSTSGGAFSAFAEQVIEQNGVVVGAAYVEDLKVKHICVTNIEGLSKLRLSKYVQSEIGLVFREIREYLKSGRIVLFCGTPCQVAALRSLFPKEDKLICIDFICHGVPSPMMLEKYNEWLGQRIGKISHINFRDKTKGWYDSLRLVTMQNKEQHFLKGVDDSFWVGFNNHNNNLQLSCYQCKFVGQERIADITIADFWGIGKQIPFGHFEEIEKGISMVLVNSRRGEKLMEMCHENMIAIPRTMEEVLHRNFHLLTSCKQPQSRETFYKDLNAKTFEEIMRIYLTPSLKGKIVKIWREYLPASLIAKIRMRNQK